MKQFIRAYLDVSTGHITKKDDELLKLAIGDSEFQLRIGREADGIIYVEDKDQGYYVKILGDAFTEEYLADVFGNLTDIGFSSSFIDLLKILIKHRNRSTTNLLFGVDAMTIYYVGIEFDADAMIYDELPVHEW